MPTTIAPLLKLLVVFVLLVVLYFSRTIVLTSLVGIGIGVLVSPLLDYLQGRLELKRGFAAVVLLLGALALGAGTGVVLSWGIVDQANSLADRLPEIAGGFAPSWPPFSSAFRGYWTASLAPGLRRGSLFNLRWDQIDFANRLVRIPRTKSGRPLSLPMNATTISTLQTLHAAGDLTSPCVFPHTVGPRAGEPVRDIKNGFHRALELAEIRDSPVTRYRSTNQRWLWTRSGLSSRQPETTMSPCVPRLLRPLSVTHRGKGSGRTSCYAACRNVWIRTT